MATDGVEETETLMLPSAVVLRFAVTVRSFRLIVERDRSERISRCGVGVDAPLQRCRMLIHVQFLTATKKSAVAHSHWRKISARSVCQ